MENVEHIIIDNTLKSIAEAANADREAQEIANMAK